MGLDIRLPIGVLFSVFGLILAIFGALSDSSLYVRQSLGINVNLIWGLVLLGFGFTMLLLVWVKARSSRAAARKTSDFSK